MKVAVPVAVELSPPHVALIEYVPAIQEFVPPPTTTSLQAPVVPFTASSERSTVSLAGLNITAITAVLGPGGGDTVPFTFIDCVPEYEADAVLSATVYLL